MSWWTLPKSLFSILHNIVRTPRTISPYVFSEQSSLLASEDPTGSDCHHLSHEARNLCWVTCRWQDYFVASPHAAAIGLHSAQSLVTGEAGLGSLWIHSVDAWIYAKKTSFRLFPQQRATGTAASWSLIDCPQVKLGLYSRYWNSKFLTLPVHSLREVTGIHRNISQPHALLMANNES